MKKILTSVVALFLSLTAVNAQGNFAKEGADMKLVRSTQFAAPMLNAQKSPAGMQKIQLDEGERIMGFYDSDDLGSGVGLGANKNLIAGSEFTKDVIGNFVGGQITKVRFGLGESVGASKVYIHPVNSEGQIQSAVSTQEVPTTQQGWNDVTLSTPVTIEKGYTYVIAFDYKDRAQHFPLLVDGKIDGAMPGTEGGCLIYGDLGNGTGWYTLGTEYGNFCIQAVVKGGSFIDSDIAIMGMNADLYMKAGGTGEINYMIKNVGNNIPTSYKISVDIDGNVVATFDTPIQLKNTTQSVKANINIPASLATGKHVTTLQVTEINGQKPSENIEDDKMAVNTTVYTKSYPRQKNVFEQFTSTTCGNCPYADPIIENLKKLNSNLIHIAHHNNIPSSGDKMVCTDALSISNTLCEGGNPSGCLNRFLETDPELNTQGLLSLPLGYQPSYAEAAARMLTATIENSNKIPSFASINIKTNFDENTRVLSIEVYGEGDENFDLLMDNNAGLSVYLLEDGLVYDQADYNKGGYVRTTHNNVMRKAVSNVWGDKINWTGNKYSNKYEITLIKGWKEANMNVVAFINRPFVAGESTRDGVFINNAEIVKLGTSTGINDAIVDNADAKEVARYTLDGRQITSPVKGVNIVKLSNGKTMKVLVK